MDDFSHFLPRCSWQPSCWWKLFSSMRCKGSSHSKCPSGASAGFWFALPSAWWRCWRIYLSSANILGWVWWATWLNMSCGSMIPTYYVEYPVALEKSMECMLVLPAVFSIISYHIISYHIISYPYLNYSKWLFLCGKTNPLRFQTLIIWIHHERQTCGSANTLAYTLYDAFTIHCWWRYSPLKTLSMSIARIYIIMIILGIYDALI